jgi:hypothetical protein
MEEANFESLLPVSLRHLQKKGQNKPTLLWETQPLLADTIFLRTSPSRGARLFYDPSVLHLSQDEMRDFAVWTDISPLA